jgi:hypothetical protein
MTLDAFSGKRIHEILERCKSGNTSRLRQEPTREYCCRVMCNIQIGQEVLPKMLLDMSDEIVTCMNMYQDNTNIQEQGCGALGKIWNRFKEDTRHSIWRGYESRVISVILQSMGAHTQHEGIQ